MPTALIVTSMAHVGGTEIATSMQAKALVAEGWQVAIIGTEGPLTPALEREGVEAISADFYSHNPFVLLRSLFVMVTAIRKLRPNVVHCQMARPVPLAWAAIQLAGRTAQAKLFWTSRGLEARSYPRVVPFFNKLGIRALGNCAGEEEKLLRYGMASKRCSHIYNAYRLSPSDRRVERPPEPPLVIGTLAALRPDRRIDHFVEMAAHLIPLLGPDRRVEFHVAGDGPARVELENLVDRHGLTELFRFFGNVNDVPGFLGGVHVFASTAFSENSDWGAGLSNSIIEAMVIGVPVVSYDAAGIGEIVHEGKTGRLVPPGDISALSAATHELSNDSAKAEAFAEAAHQNIVSVCDPDVVLTRLLELYRDL